MVYLDRIQLVGFSTKFRTGAVCSTNDDCSDPWACVDGKCAVDASETCSWEEHCAGMCRHIFLSMRLAAHRSEGAPCIISDDCSDPYACVYGVCATDPDA
jgi:chitosanase